MKSVFKICLVAVLLMSAGLVNAQTLKFAHINSQALIAAMPESKAAETEIQKQAKGLEDQLASMQKELQSKYTELTEKSDSLTDIVRQAKIEDFQNLQQRIESFNSMAQQQLQKKQGELMQPIFAKAKSTIETVAKEQGVLYVFDEEAVLYKSDDSIDLLPIVKTKLGIK